MPPPEKFSGKRLWQTFKDGFFALMSPVILLFTMMSGAITPTEAGIVGVLYSIIVGLIYKELTIKKFIQALEQTVITCALIMFLLGLGSAVGWFFTADGVPKMVMNGLFALTDNKYILLILINIMLLVLGMFMNSTTIQLITVPMLLPFMKAIGMDNVQFGVMMTINILIGTMTPPFGVGLFIMTTISDLKMEQVLKATKPFFIPIILCLIAITFVPAFTLWLPNLLFR